MGSKMSPKDGNDRIELKRVIDLIKDDHKTCTTKILSSYSSLTEGNLKVNRKLKKS